MKRIKNFFQEVYESCTQFSFYQSIPKQLYSASMRYFLALITLVVIIFTTVTGIGIAQGIDLVVTQFESTAPDFVFTITDGTFSSNLREPYIINLEEGQLISDTAQPLPENIVPLIIDTTGSFTSLEDFEGGMLITKEKMLVKQNYEVREVSFKEMPDGSLGKQQILDTARHYKGMVKVLAILSFALVVWIGFFIWYFLYLGFFAVIGLLFTKNKLRFGQLHQVGMYAITAPLLFNTLWGFFSTSIPYLFTAIFLVFFIGGLKTILQKL